jgi:hypothetical protein
LVSALAVLHAGGTQEQARRQFSLYYLFLPIQDGRVMLGHLEQYEAWLRRQRAKASPEALRRWVCSAYRPGKPSREYWPCDPYPLMVITQPARGDGGEQVIWPSNACPQTIPTAEGRAAPDRNELRR